MWVHFPSFHRILKQQVKLHSSVSSSTWSLTKRKQVLKHSGEMVGGDLCILLSFTADIPSFINEWRGELGGGIGMGGSNRVVLVFFRDSWNSWILPGSLCVLKAGSSPTFLWSAGQVACLWVRRLSLVSASVYPSCLHSPAYLSAHRSEVVPSVPTGVAGTAEPMCAQDTNHCLCVRDADTKAMGGSS